MAVAVPGRGRSWRVVPEGTAWATALAVVPADGPCCGAGAPSAGANGPRGKRGYEVVSAACCRVPRLLPLRTARQVPPSLHDPLPPPVPRRTAHGARSTPSPARGPRPGSVITISAHGSSGPTSRRPSWASRTRFAMTRPSPVRGSWWCKKAPTEIRPFDRATRSCTGPSAT